MTRASIFLLRAPAIVALVCATIGCGGGDPPPDSSNNPTPQDGSVAISGAERIGWSQRAQSVAQASAFGYRLYVDGAGVPLTSVACEGNQSGGIDCSAPLPSLSPGRHTLELSTSTDQGESSRSEPLVVTVARSLTANVAAPSAAAPSGAAEAADAGGADRSSVACSADGRSCFDVAAIATLPSDARRLIAMPDGRLFAISGDDRVASIDSSGQIVSIAVDAACRPPYRSHLSDLAPSPDFERDRLVYAAWACEARGLPTLLLLATYRELGDSFGEAQIVEAMPIAAPDVDIAVGPGARLHVAARTRASWGLFAFALADGRLAQARPRVMMTLPAAADVASTSGHLYVLTSGALLRADGRSTQTERVFTAQRSGFAASFLAPSPTSAAGCDVAWLASADTIVHATIPANLSGGRSQPETDLLDLRSTGQVDAIAAGVSGELFAVITQPATAPNAASRMLARIVPQQPPGAPCD